MIITLIHNRHRNRHGTHCKINTFRQTNLKNKEYHTCDDRNEARINQLLQLKTAFILQHDAMCPAKNMKNSDEHGCIDNTDISKKRITKRNPYKSTVIIGHCKLLN